MRDMLLGEIIWEYLGWTMPGPLRRRLLVVRRMGRGARC